MNLKRFTGRTSKEAMTKVREALGEDAVIVSTRPHGQGVEIVAMASDSVSSIDRWESRPAPLETTSERQRPAAIEQDRYDPAMDPILSARTEDRYGSQSSEPLSGRLAQRVNPSQMATPPHMGMKPEDVNSDVEKLAMSTLSFQDYVRERMLKRRKAALEQEEQDKRSQAAPVPTSAVAMERRLQERESASQGSRLVETARSSAMSDTGESPVRMAREPDTRRATSTVAARTAPAAVKPAEVSRSAASMHIKPRHQGVIDLSQPEEREERFVKRATVAASHDEQVAMMSELKAMKGLIEDRFGALAFMEKMQRTPACAKLSQKLLDCGYTPGLVRKLVEAMPADVSDEVAWATAALERNLHTAEQEPHFEVVGGVYAMIGSTGVGKTTTTAKVAAAFAARYGANQLGLITLDAYRVAAHEQLRAYGRILGVPVHTAHDKVALEDLLDLLSNKKMVLIDTAGIAQRDARTKELLEMLSHPSIKKIVVVNAAAQGETIDDVLQAYQASQAHGVILSKVDEAVKLAPALDAMIRHKLVLRGVANGQRVPEDWHHISSSALMQLSLRAHTSSSTFRLDANDVNLVFTTPPSMADSSSVHARSMR